MIQKQKRVGGSEAKAFLTDGCLLALLAPGFSFPQDVHTGNSEQGVGEVSLSCLPWSTSGFPRQRLRYIRDTSWAELQSLSFFPNPTWGTCSPMEPLCW